MIDFIAKYWVEFILTLITSGSAYVLKKVYSDFKKEKTEQNILKEGMVALLHNSLFRNCEQYIARGEITVNELDNLETLYKSYHALGGNGTGTALYERCKSLSLKAN